MNLFISHNSFVVKTYYTNDLWPPSSADLILWIARIWGVVRERVYQKPARCADELKQRLIETWSAIQRSIIDQAIDRWRERLMSARVKAGVKHVEYLL